MDPEYLEELAQYLNQKITGCAGCGAPVFQGNVPVGQVVICGQCLLHQQDLEEEAASAAIDRAKGHYDL